MLILTSGLSTAQLVTILKCRDSGRASPAVNENLEISAIRFRYNHNYLIQKIIENEYANRIITHRPELLAG
jgi:hypothetical protein